MPMYLWRAKCCLTERQEYRPDHNDQEVPPEEKCDCGECDWERVQCAPVLLNKRKGTW